MFRVLKTGIHLMRTGRVEANLALLLEDELREPYPRDLNAAKQTDGEHAAAKDDERYGADIDRLRTALEAARDRSGLPDSPTARPALHDFVVRARLAARS